MACKFKTRNPLLLKFIVKKNAKSYDRLKSSRSWFRVAVAGVSVMRVLEQGQWESACYSLG